MEDNTELEEASDNENVFEDAIFNKVNQREGWEFDRPSDDMPGGAAMNSDP